MIRALIFYIFCRVFLSQKMQICQPCTCRPFLTTVPKERLTNEFYLKRWPVVENFSSVCRIPDGRVRGCKFAKRGRKVNPRTGLIDKRVWHFYSHAKKRQMQIAKYCRGRRGWWRIAAVK